MERIKITASEGMILTNGEVYGKTIYLAEGVSADNFWEIPIAEYEAIQQEKLRNPFENEVEL